MGVNPPGPWVAARSTATPIVEVSTLTPGLPRTSVTLICGAVRCRGNDGHPTAASTSGALVTSGGSLALTNPTVTASADPSSIGESSFYGLGAG